MNFIDTADAYGPHTNETLIGDALFPYPDDLVIATKGGVVRPGPVLDEMEFTGRRPYLRQAAHLNARRLGVDRIDLYYLHVVATDAPFEDQVSTLKELRDDGVIRHIVLSNVSLEQLERARLITDIAAVSCRYNIGDRTGGSVLETVEQAGGVFSP